MEEKEKLVEQLRTMKETDIRTVDKESLVDIKDVKINPNLSDQERMVERLPAVCPAYKSIASVKNTRLVTTIFVLIYMNDLKKFIRMIKNR